MASPQWVSRGNRSCEASKFSKECARSTIRASRSNSDSVPQGTGGASLRSNPPDRARTASPPAARSSQRAAERARHRASGRSMRNQLAVAIPTMTARRRSSVGQNDQWVPR